MNTHTHKRTQRTKMRFVAVTLTCKTEQKYKISYSSFDHVRLL